MSDKVEYLQMIQQVVNRMAGNSFALKGWSVTLVAALFALAAKDAEPSFVLLAYFPALMFWILDGYFLRQERLYRKLYEAACMSNDPPSFWMDASKLATEGVGVGWILACASRTLLVFHGTVGVSILVTWMLRQ